VTASISSLAFVVWVLLAERNTLTRATSILLVSRS